MNEDEGIFGYIDYLKWSAHNNIFNYICLRNKCDDNFLRHIKKVFFFNLPVFTVKETQFYKLREILFDEWDIFPRSLRNEAYRTFLTTRVKPGMNTFNILTDIHNVDINLYIHE